MSYMNIPLKRKNTLEENPLEEEYANFSFSDPPKLLTFGGPVPLQLVYISHSLRNAKGEILRLSKNLEEIKTHLVKDELEDSLQVQETGSLRIFSFEEHVSSFLNVEDLEKTLSFLRENLFFRIHKKRLEVNRVFDMQSVIKALKNFSFLQYENEKIFMIDYEHSVHREKGLFMFSTYIYEYKSLF